MIIHMSTKGFLDKPFIPSPLGNFLICFIEIFHFMPIYCTQSFEPALTQYSKKHATHPAAMLHFFKNNSEPEAVLLNASFLKKVASLP